MRAGKGGGEDVCYFVVRRKPSGFEARTPKGGRPQGQKQRRPFPANPFTIRGEDRCYFGC